MSTTIKQMIETLQAAENGEIIQWRPRNPKKSAWKDTYGSIVNGRYDLSWNWGLYEYRQKPKEVTLYVNIHESDSTRWLISHSDEREACANVLPEAIAVAVPLTFTPGEGT